MATCLLHTCFNYMCAYFNHCSNSYLNDIASINYVFLPILLSMSAVTQLLLLLQNIVKAVEERSTTEYGDLIRFILF